MEPVAIDESELAAIWCRHLRLDSVDRNDDFFAIGGTSLQAAQIFLEIEEKTGARFPITTLFDAPTIGELARVLCGGRETNSGSLVLLRPGGGGEPLFLIHPVGGSVLVYRELAQAMSLPIPVIGIQAAGLSGDGAFHDRVEDMAEHYCRQILETQPVGPYRLAGYSAGGIIAFAMAQKLADIGRPVGFLGLINTHFLFRRTGHQTGSIRRLRAHLQYARERTVSRAAGEFTDFWRYRRKLRKAEATLDAKGTTFEQRRDTLVAQARKQHQARSDNRYALIQQLQQIAINFYQPSVYEGSVYLYKTADYHDNRPGEIGWARLAAKGLRTAPIPGTHFTLLRDDNAHVLAALLSRDVASRDPVR